jgi:hypothetical protein
MTCLLVGGVAMMLAAPTFSLHWTHSVEKVIWQEDWVVEGAALRLETARVKGSGAGMEPGENARLVAGWWEWHPRTLVPSLVLAASGATQGGWVLCTSAGCETLGAKAGEALTLAPCAP